MRLLFVDAFDSFSNNIVALLTVLLHADVHVLPIDAPLTPLQLRQELRRYDAVVLGPGPGTPENPDDVGLMRHIWMSVENLPVLGICLGFQSLVAAHGGPVRRLRAGGQHGMVRQVDHIQEDIFADVSPFFKATLYHSLGADLGQNDVPAEDWSRQRWLPFKEYPDLVPLAWTELGGEERGGKERILMAVRHRQRPFWGLQYHPESVCTDRASHAVLVNWMKEAQAWNARCGRVVSSNGGPLMAHQPTRSSLLGRERILPPSTKQARPLFLSETIDLPDHVQVPDLVEALAATTDNDEHIVLDSSSAEMGQNQDDNTDQVDPEATRGRFSIVALDVSQALRIGYRAGESWATLHHGATAAATTKVPLSPGQSIWQLLAEFHKERRIHVPLPDNDIPFVGGFMGYITYEQGLHDLGIALPSNCSSPAGRPDICFVWVTRSLVVDHQKRVVHVQEMAETADGWVEAAMEKLKNVTSAKAKKTTFSATNICRPDPCVYEEKVRICQEHIAAGDSYELCLTDETLVQTASKETTTAWQLYRTLRTRNPAPFASFLRLGSATLVSSSPERFLKYETHPDSKTTTTCSMRPMKGTVRRSATVATLADAVRELRIPKEEAENLMIVDLVRHDLHAVCGPGNVDVPVLLQVEPYGHVFQMVSVVEGRLKGKREKDEKEENEKGEHDKNENNKTGLDVLAASLPPGSMTGAPKKRSCELLLRDNLEHRPRSLYSGVVGYMCAATGRGDWSVTIRSLFRWDDETTATTETWHVGAGGAVTILSTPEGERDEMMTKLGGPLGIFEEEKGR